MNNSDNTYNGWTNYETWLTNIWITESQYEVNTIIQHSLSVNNDTYEVSLYIKHCMEEGLEYLDIQTGLFRDMLSASLTHVNWYEIAEHFTEQAQEYMEE